MLKTISKYIVIFLLLGTFFIAPKTFAQTTASNAASQDYSKIIKITPVILNINLKLGQKQDYDLKMENLLNQPLGIGLRLETLDATDELTGMVFGTPHPNSPFVSWTEINEKEFIISEKGKKTIKISVKFPKNTKEGSYTSVIFVTPFFSKTLDKTSQSVVGRIGVLAFANIGVPREREPKDMARILNFNFITKNGKSKTVVRVQNTFNFNLSTKAKIELSPIFFGQKQTIQLDDKRILSGKIRRWEVPVQLRPGIYQAKLAVSLGQGRQIYKDIFFTVPSFASFVPYLVVLIIILLIILLRKRLKKALFILYKGT